MSAQPQFDEPQTESIPETADVLKIADEPIVARRSELENYSTCPLSARLRETRFKSVDSIAVSGEECHKAISGAIQTYVDSRGALSRAEIVEQIQRNVLASRSDQVVDAHAALKYSAYSIGAYISDIHPSNILAFDGGEDTWVADEVEDPETGLLKSVRRSLSGQLDVDLQFGNKTLRLTAEMDLLHATRSHGLLQLSDWKSGFKLWSEAAVAASFQFRFYAFLILETYNQKKEDSEDFEIEAVDVVIWNTRDNKRTFPVRFYRKDMEPIRAMILGAAGDYFMNRTKPLALVESRPTREGCRLCSCAAECTACDGDIHDIHADPVKAVDVLYAMTRRVEEYEKTLKGAAMYSGEIVTPSGNAFGFKRVKRATKPKAELYTTKASSDDEE